MSVELLARIQFALTVGFHYLYPPLSIGLGVLIVCLEGRWFFSQDPLYRRLSEFWTRIFGLTFAVGVATGIVMEFEFGTNWASYSRFVGDVFGSPLAAEGVFAFFLESIFLGVLLFGRGRVTPRFYLASSVLVALGAHLSAFWIIVANSWQQTPAGFHIVGEGLKARAEITDFWAMVFNPSTLDRYSHVLGGAWMTGAFFMVSVSAYYLLRKRHEDGAKASLKTGLALAALASILQLGTGHVSAITVAKHQPAKLAAFEGLYETRTWAPLYAFGWVDAKNERVIGLPVPGLLSLLVHFDPRVPVTGLREIPAQDRPPVNFVFQTYHIMIGLGMLMIGLSAAGLFFWWRGSLFEQRWLLRAYLPSFLLPQIANQTGWISAEVGRQPWIVYNLLRTSQGFSKTVGASEILFSLILFALLYALIFILFAMTLWNKIEHGPDEATQEPTWT
ncbi:MAG: cytochrome ubiquinol oxidase subunit I [Elusimicrobiota bacterium]|jgi:cytochrome d ubiquinol oxidase subunit I